MIVITRTPFRISFLGGGSDYPEWHQKHIGMVLGATINKYCYITYQPDQPKFRILHSIFEECDNLVEIKHPAAFVCLATNLLRKPCSIIHASDLPSKSGIGSSSAYVVGLLHALYVAHGKTDITMEQLAKAATTIEQDVLREPVGNQDQILTAYGGIQQLVFHPTGEIGTRELELSPARLQEFQQYLMLFHVGPRPTTTPVPLTFPVDITRRLATMAKEGTDLLLSDEPIEYFGELLHEAWYLKKQMSPSISTNGIDDLYTFAVFNGGAIGGKLLGAGGGGYMLLFVPPKDQERTRAVLAPLKQVPFQFEGEGTKVIYNG